MNHALLDQAHREFWGSLIHSLDPEFWLTFNFIRRYSDQEAIEAFKFAMRAIQRRIPSSRIIRGAAFIERTWKNAHFSDCLHLHALLCGVDANLRNPDEYLHQVTHRVITRLVDSQGREMAEVDTIDLQRVYEPDGVVKYATKDLNRKDSQRRSRIWLITPDGLDMTTDQLQF